MTLNTRDRSVLFESLSKLADPEAVDAMLAHFPTRDVDEPLTRDYLDSRLIEFREEIRLAILAEFRAFDAKFASFRQEMTNEIGTLRGELDSKIDSKIGSLDAKIGSVDAKIGSLRQEMEVQFRRSLQWTVRTMIALAALIVAAATLVVTLR